MKLNLYSSPQIAHPLLPSCTSKVPLPTIPVSQECQRRLKQSPNFDPSKQSRKFRQ